MSQPDIIHFHNTSSLTTCSEPGRSFTGGGLKKKKKRNIVRSATLFCTSSIRDSAKRNSIKAPFSLCNCFTLCISKRNNRETWTNYEQPTVSMNLCRIRDMKLKLWKCNANIYFNGTKHNTKLCTHNNKFIIKP
jgi:hypothetical protein